MSKTLALLTFALFLSAADLFYFYYVRTYQPGDVFRYSLDTVTEINGQFESQETAYSNHFVFGGQATGEEITWDRFFVRDKAGRRDLSILAQKVPPMRLSLDGNWRNRVPDIVIPAMRGMILDLYTFYVAVGEGSGIRRVKRPGDVYENGELRRVNWSDERFVPLGEGCTLMRLRLDSADRQTARVTSDFQPPPAPCLSPDKEEAVVAGVPNNFQTIQHDDDGFTYLWGMESFTIQSEIDVPTGAIRSATMDNTLNLKMRRRCDANLKNCGPDTPVVIHRKATLQRR